MKLYELWALMESMMKHRPEVLDGDVISVDLVFREMTLGMPNGPEVIRLGRPQYAGAEKSAEAKARFKAERTDPSLKPESVFDGGDY